MSNRLTKFCVVPLLAVALMAAQPAHAQSTPAAPAAEPPALASLQTMVTNLGYTTTVSPDKQHFYFDWQSPKYTYRIDLALSTGGDLVYVYNYIDTFDASQVAKLPYVKMMEYQNTSNFYFSFDNNSKGEDLYANSVFGVAGVTPALLRTQLTNFAKSLDDTDTLWNTKLWK